MSTGINRLAPQPHQITWEQDYRERMNPQLLTRLLHDAIPVLEDMAANDPVDDARAYAKRALSKIRPPAPDPVKEGATTQNTKTDNSGSLGDHR